MARGSGPAYTHTRAYTHTTHTQHTRTHTTHIHTQTTHTHAHNTRAHTHTHANTRSSFVLTHAHCVLSGRRRWGERRPARIAPPTPFAPPAVPRAATMFTPLPLPPRPTLCRSAVTDDYDDESFTTPRREMLVFSATRVYTHYNYYRGRRRRAVLLHNAVYTPLRRCTQTPRCKPSAPLLCTDTTPPPSPSEWCILFTAF